MVSRWLRRTSFRRTLLATVVLLLTATVGLLGWRVLAQDRQLASQRLLVDREVIAGRVVTAFEQRFSDIERWLDRALTRGEIDVAESDMDGAVVIVTDRAGFRIWPAHRLRYYPQLPPRPADREAEALVERAQVRLRAGRFADALADCDRLEALGQAPIGDVVGGMPAALVAELGRMTVHERRESREDIVAAARRLFERLRSGRFPVSEATYQFLNERAYRALATPPTPDPQIALAEAAVWLWEQRVANPEFASSGGLSRNLPSGPVVIVWTSSAESFAAWIASRQLLDSGDRTNGLHRRIRGIQPLPRRKVHCYDIRWCGGGERRCHRARARRDRRSARAASGPAW